MLFGCPSGLWRAIPVWLLCVVLCLTATRVTPLERLFCGPSDPSKANLAEDFTLGVPIWDRIHRTHLRQAADHSVVIFELEEIGVKQR